MPTYVCACTTNAVRALISGKWYVRNSVGAPATDIIVLLLLTPLSASFSSFFPPFSAILYFLFCFVVCLTLFVLNNLCNLYPYLALLNCQKLSNMKRHLSDSETENCDDYEDCSR